MSRVALVAAAIAAGVVASASGPTFWVVATQADFLRGQPDGVSIDEIGRLTAGPAITSLADAAEPQVWSLAVAGDGTWYAGTGGEGRVLRGRPGQAVDTILKTDEHNIYAVAVGPDGRVYAASSPDGKVYAIERDGTSKMIFDPGEKYIWSLLVDRRGRVWVGTGTPAALYRIDTDGTSHAVYHPPADHVVALALDGEGRVLAGTEGPGRLYRFDASDRPSALIDSGMTELRGIALARDGSIYASALSAGDGASTDASAGTLSVSIAASPTSPGGASGANGTAPTAKSAIFRIDPAGGWTTFWETSVSIYDIAVDDDQSVLAATGPGGAVYRVRANGTSVLVNAADAKELTRLVPAGARRLIATANPGRVVALGSTPAPSSSYVSPVRDAKGPATWGQIRWEASPGVALYTRSGNTDKADDSWSDWSSPYTTRDGQPITSAPARYLQWKAVFTAAAGAAAPSLTSVTVAYLPQNSRPSVSAITIYPPGVIFQKPFTGDDSAVAGLDDTVRRPLTPDQPPPGFGKRMYQKGLQTLSWKADDEDGDRLTYTLVYRREGESGWHALRAGLTDAVFVWDTTTVPDGRYIVQVTASDALSNTVERTLTGDRESDAFDIDNTPPVITVDVVRDASGIHANVHVHDAQTAIDRVEIAWGASTWSTIYPVDGMTDSRDERYVIPVKSEADLAQLIIRATDVMENWTSQPAVAR